MRRIASIGLKLGVTAAVAFATAGTAQAAFPQFSDCPLRGAEAGSCIDVQSRDGSSLNIKGFNVPLHDTLRIRGALSYPADGSIVFVPPRGTNGFFATAVDVPGGLLGIDLPFGFTRVSAAPQLVGPASNIRVDLATLSISVPVKLKLSNTFLSSSCYIGSDRNPVRLNLITGTTAPPAPNRPIRGGTGTPSIVNGALVLAGNTNVDNSFAIPAASGCGLFNGGLIDTLINLKLSLPSAGGNNTMIVKNDVGIQSPQ
jgi:hypothetical protein